MKAEKGRLEEDQESAMIAFDCQGYRCVVAYGHGEAIVKITKYLEAA